MNKHTPTPWKAFTEENFNGWWAFGTENSDGTVCEFGSCDGGFNKEDAEHIVRCVNSHEALVKALEDCVRVFENELSGLTMIGPELRQARAALAAAGAPQ